MKNEMLRRRMECCKFKDKMQVVNYVDVNFKTIIPFLFKTLYYHKNFHISCSLCESLNNSFLFVIYHLLFLMSDLQLQFSDVF